MRLLALVVLTAAKLGHLTLFALALAFTRRRQLGGSDGGGANRDVRARADQQNLIKFDTAALVCVELLDTHHSTFLNAVLFTARGDHGIHNCNSEAGRGAAKEPRIVSGEALRVKLG